MGKNIFRHFFIAMGALTYLVAAPVFIYQYLGVINEWPYVFLNVIYDAAGDWWLDINWSSPVIWTTLTLIFIAALSYAIYKRDDYVDYREPEIQSQPGF